MLMTQRPLIHFECRFHRGGQCPSVMLCVLQLAARVWILVAAAAHHEQRGHTWIVGFQILLSVPGIVAVPLAESHGCVVTGISKNNRLQFSGGIANTQDGYRMIDRAKRIGVIDNSRCGRRATVHGHARPRHAVRQRDRLQPVDRLTDNLNNLPGELFKIVLRVVAPISRAAMRM